MNLKEARKKSGLTQEEAAAVFGLKYRTYQNYENGVTTPTMEKASEFARYFNCCIAELFDLEDGTASNSSNFVRIPLFGSITAGTPTDMESADETHEIPERMHLRYPDAFLLRVDGESMNKVLPNGSYALVNPETEVLDGNVYAVCINGYEATVKRVRVLHNGIELLPESNDPTFSPLVYDYDDHDDELTVIGRIVWYCLPYDYEI